MARHRHGRGEGTGSLWHATLEPDDDARPRPALRGDPAVDVAIVGAGFTGLWTAYSLAARDPSLRVAVLERETASFGASGRNGGWWSATRPRAVGPRRAGGKGAGRPRSAPFKAASTSSATWSAPRGSTAASPRAVPSSSRRTPRQLQRLSGRPAEWDRYGLDGTYELWDGSAPVRSSVPQGSSARCTHPSGRAPPGPPRAASPAGGTPRRIRVRAHHRHRDRAGSRHDDARYGPADVIVRSTEAYTRTLAGERRRTPPRQLRDRHRADRRRYVEADRARRPRAVRGRVHDGCLRPTNLRRSHRVGRPQRAVSLGIGHPTHADAERTDRGAGCATGSSRCSRSLPASASRITGVGCSVSHATCVRARPRPRERARVGGGYFGSGVDRKSRGSNAGRSHLWRRHRPHAPRVGRPPRPTLGTRAGALVGRPRGDDGRGSHRLA